MLRANSLMHKMTYLDGHTRGILVNLRWQVEWDQVWLKLKKYYKKNETSFILYVIWMNP